MSCNPLYTDDKVPQLLRMHCNTCIYMDTAIMRTLLHDPIVSNDTWRSGHYNIHCMRIVIVNMWSHCSMTLKRHINHDIITIHTTTTRLLIFTHGLLAIKAHYHFTLTCYCHSYLHINFIEHFD